MQPSLQIPEPLKEAESPIAVIPLSLTTTNSLPFSGFASGGHVTEMESLTVWPAVSGFSPFSQYAFIDGCVFLWTRDSPEHGPYRTP